MNRADRRDFEAHYEGPRDWHEFPEQEEEMSEVKDRHTCGGCRWFDDKLETCLYHDGTGLHSDIERTPDDEACSDFEPIGGWQE